jgi:hypothetical protein
MAQNHISASENNGSMRMVAIVRIIRHRSRLPTSTVFQALVLVLSRNYI